MSNMMKNKKTNLSKELISKIFSIGLELDILNEDLRAINEDLFYLQALKNELIFNINYLRGNNIIVLMKEYCRSIVQLKSIKDQTDETQVLLLQTQEKLNDKIKERRTYLKKLGLSLYSIDELNVRKLSNRDSNIISFKKKKEEYDKKREDKKSIKG